MKTLPLLLSLILVGSATACAHLGDTLPQAVQRYGAAVRTSDGFTWFAKSGFLIGLHFAAKGVADGVAYQKTPTAEELTPAELNFLMTANRKAKWSLLDESATSKVWTVPDGAGARYEPADQTLYVGTKEFFASDTLNKLLKEMRSKGSQAERATVAKKLEGF